MTIRDGKSFEKKHRLDSWGFVVWHAIGGTHPRGRNSPVKWRSMVDSAGVLPVKFHLGLEQLPRTKRLACIALALVEKGGWRTSAHTKSPLGLLLQERFEFP
jgi:hypothetical protein